MKKLICVALIALMLCTMLCACNKKEEPIETFTCDVCGEEKSGKKYKEEIFGEKIVWCKDCNEEMEDLLG